MTLLRFALPLAALILPAAASAQSLVGEWLVTVETGDTTIFEEVKVKKAGEGYEITAKLVGDVPPGLIDAGPGFDIVIDGDNFSYKRTASSEQGSLTVAYQGVVKGDTFEGTVDIGGFQVPYNGQRTAAGE